MDYLFYNMWRIIMKNKKLYLVIFSVLILFNYSYSQDSKSTFYFSPGCGISWNFSSSILLEFKISFGKMISEKNYYNVTLGKKILLKNKSIYPNYEHYYLDFQTGSFFGIYPFSAGMGFGVAIFSVSEKLEIYPTLTTFAGAGLFGTINYVFRKNLFDMGLQVVLPIAFDEDYRRFDH